MNLSEELKWRGFVNQTTLKSLEALDGNPLTFYWGVDPSSDSMQIGNLAAAMMVRAFIKNGHKPILLVGGATGLIGDPDGKKQERDLKEIDVIAKNVEGLTEQYKTIFNGFDFETVNNKDWFKDINYVDFLRTIGKHYSMTQLLDREFVQSRIGEGGAGISYAEFSYSLIQGYDFLHLFRAKGVTLQVCGADQWGNSLAGVELIRKVEGAEAHVYSVPLIINQATGIKFGKSEDGAVWLDAKKTSVYKFYQFLLNLDDKGVGDYLKIFTSIMPEEYDALMDKFKAAPQERSAQKYLAFEVTKLVHGEDRAESVKRISEVLFGEKQFSDLSDKEVDELSKEIPTVKPQSVLSALIDSGTVSSGSEARRLVSDGAISINGNKILEDSDIKETSLIKKGKNTFLLVR